MNDIVVGKDLLLEIMIEASERDTCWPGCVDEWDSKNRQWGHCAMYALEYDLELEKAGVKNRGLAQCQAVTPDGSYLHVVSIIDGRIDDVSGSQFKNGVRYENIVSISREEVLAWPDGESERFDKFHERVYALREKKEI